MRVALSTLLTLTTLLSCEPIADGLDPLAVRSAEEPDPVGQVGTAEASETTLAAPEGAESQAPRNLLLLTVDTLRADHLEAYGYGQPTSPNLLELAERSVVFERCQSTSSWTLPAMASLMTSLHPGTHRCVSTRSALAPSYETLAEVLKASGFSTGAFAANMFTTARYGFDQGFDGFTPVLDDMGRPRRRSRRGRSRHDEVTSGLLTDQALNWLEDREPDDRWFLWVHYFDPHAEYVPHPELDVRLGADSVMQLRYDAEIAFTDAHLGRILDRLEQLDLDQQTLIVMTADHGEEFGDHGGHGHKRTLHEEVLHVPLMFYAPGVAARRVSDTVSLVDVMPTVLETLGLTAIEGLHGRSLARAMRGQPLASAPAFAELDRGPGQSLLLAVADDRWKLVIDLDGGAPMLFDTEADPNEQDDIAAEQPATVERLATWARDRHEQTVLHADQHEDLGELELTPAEIAALEALGYVGGR